MGTYDSNLLTLKALDLAHTAVGPLDPDFVASKDGGTYFWFGCIFNLPDCSPPCQVRDIVLPPGEDQTILNLVFDASPTAPEGATTEVELVNDRTLSEIINSFTVSGLSRFPVLVPSQVKVLPPDPSAVFFQRGDADSSGSIDITDAVRVLGHLFLGEEKIPCPDAADFSDQGSVDISGAIAILNYLFLGGVQPAVPFPNRGLDPSPDDLEDCVVTR
jgi:hypothetical protein